MNGRHLWLLAAALLLATLALPYVFPGEYGGSDGAALEQVKESGGTSWFSPVYEPPSGEVESLLFAVQAAAGGVLLGYYLGRLKWRDS